MKRLKSFIAMGAVLLPLFMALLGHPPAHADAPSACSLITLTQPHSDGCNAEIAANPEPLLERPVQFDPKLHGVSTPRSVLLPETPLPYRLGWILKAWYYSDAPGVEPPAFTKDRIYDKAKLVWLYATVNINGMDWHLIGPDRWMAGEHIAALYFANRPEKVSGRWVALDLTEQTLIAFEEETPVFATLISAAWGGYGFTEEGLFQIYARAKHTTFRGPPWKLDNPEYNYKFVPSVQFFDGDFALHGAYWHDWFGYERTHGCINIPVGDAKWLWDWVQETADQWGPDKGAFHIPHPEKAPFVYIYHTDPTGKARQYS